MKTLAEFARVATSYRASEEGVVVTCTGDVRKSNLYIGILGQRYGYVPPVTESNPQKNRSRNWSPTPAAFPGAAGDPEADVH